MSTQTQLTPEDRDRKNAAAFVAPAPLIHGKRIAPFSAGRLQLCRQVGLRVVSGAASELDQNAAEGELIAFWLIHTLSVEAAKEACALPRAEFFSRHVEPLLWEFPARDLPKIMDYLRGEFEGVAAADVEVLPKPGPGEPEAAPPNC